MPYNLAEFLRWLSSKESACGAEDTGDLGSIPGLGRLPGSPVQYSCLENPIDRGDWWAIVHRVAKSQTQLKQLSTHALQREIDGILGIDWRYEEAKN